ncbi:MAG TPA: PilW family protein, partial [Gallionella sp.]|nr:PilW family protein [Gallionella sp.]
MKTSRPPHVMSRRNKQCGLSLIELMISITIGLLILSTMATLFSNQSRIRGELDKTSRMIDNGRYALESLSDNLRVAGFYGSYMPNGTTSADPDPCDLAAITNPASNLDELLHHVQGYRAPSLTGQIASLPTNCGLTYTAGSANTLKAGSDILVLRRTGTLTPVAAASAVAATLYFQVSNCSTDASAYKIAAGSAGFATLHDKDCTTSASLRPFIVQVYFVSPDNNPGDGIPTLKRLELDQATGAFVTTPLVEGIEYLKVDYGLDTNADGAADSYIASPTAANWPSVVSVKLSIIARNTEATRGYTDTRSYVLGSAGSVGPFNDA